MNLEEYKGVYVFAQQVDNKISSIALELIGKGKDLAKDLGTTVTAGLVGSDGRVSFFFLALRHSGIACIYGLSEPGSTAEIAERLEKAAACFRL